MPVKAADFVKKSKKDDKEKGGKSSLLDWIGKRRKGGKKVEGKDDGEN